MNRLIFVFTFCLLTSFVSSAQDWFSFNVPWTNNLKIETMTTDPISNTIVYNNLWQIEVLKGDGTKFSIAKTGYNGDHNFQGTSYFTTAYYHIDRVYVVCESSYGLIKMTTEPDFDDVIMYTPGVRNILIDHDTVWLSGSGVQDGSQMINESIYQPFVMGGRHLKKYKGRVYGRSDLSHYSQYGIYYHDGTEFVQFNISNSNLLSDTVGGFCTNYENGILFVGTAQGLSQFNGITFNNITPTTHPEMPYKAVLDAEYDHRNGKLWMVLGDDSLDAKTLTSYDGSWETYDSNNSPIDFNKFVDMVVDTLGQVWFAEEREIHVLNTNQLEGWLATEKLEKEELKVSVYPNPSTGIIHLEIGGEGNYTLEVYYSNGQLIRREENVKKSIDLDLPPAIYHYKLFGGKSFKTGKIIRL